ncbi:glycoside hydrolase family 5 protein [Candidatus Poribacteria bacterium]
MSDIAQTVLPRWRGFNLNEMLRSDAEITGRDGIFQEADFTWMADWGFDFVRLPLCYRLWIKSNELVISRDDALDIYESPLEEVDRVVELGRKYGLHVCLNFHWAPGYRVGSFAREPFNLWKDVEGLEAFCFHWQLFAKRYKGIPSDQLSFNLVNEPRSLSEEFMTRGDHERVVRAAAAAIREIDPERLIIADGVQWANIPCPEMVDLGIAQSCRGYKPRGVSHFKASNEKREFPIPTWPGGLDGPKGQPWDRKRLEEHYKPWADLARQGVGVHCGECGAFNYTPHDVFISWFRDVLDILTGCGIGYAVWNFRGALGIMDSDREDVEYEDWHGHKLDRELLSLLQEF